jgi:hypothetical protein
MPERRFNEEEVAAIFERAAEAQQVRQQQLPSREGMTLTELQEIGRQVGISGDELANAARAIELRPQATSREFLGVPIGVGLSVELGRKLSEDEWAQLVADLRQTFDAKGVVRQEGPLRYWANGNLQAHVEPTPNGDRVRLRTLKGDGRLRVGGAIAFGVLAIGAGLLRAVGIDTGDISQMTIFGVLGAAALGVGALQLPAWARLRRSQMEEVAKKLTRGS